MSAPAEKRPMFGHDVGIEGPEAGSILVCWALLSSRGLLSVLSSALLVVVIFAVLDHRRFGIDVGDGRTWPRWRPGGDSRHDANPDARMPVPHTHSGSFFHGIRLTVTRELRSPPPPDSRKTEWKSRSAALSVTPHSTGSP